MMFKPVLNCYLKIVFIYVLENKVCKCVLTGCVYLCLFTCNLYAKHCLGNMLQNIFPFQYLYCITATEVSIHVLYLILLVLIIGTSLYGEMNDQILQAGPKCSTLFSVQTRFHSIFR